MFHLQSLILIPHFECVNTASSRLSIRVSFSYLKSLRNWDGNDWITSSTLASADFYRRWKQHKTCSVNVKQARNHLHMVTEAFSDAAEYLVWFHPVHNLCLCVVYVFVFMFFKNNELKLPFLNRVTKTVPPEL